MGGTFGDGATPQSFGPGWHRVTFDRDTRVESGSGNWETSDGSIIDGYEDILAGDYIEGYVPDEAFDEVLFYEVLPQDNYVRKRKNVVAVGTREPSVMPG